MGRVEKRRWMGPGGPRGLQSRCEARRTSRVRSIRMHLRHGNDTAAPLWTRPFLFWCCFTSSAAPSGTSLRRPHRRSLRVNSAERGIYFWAVLPGIPLFRRRKWEDLLNLQSEQPKNENTASFCGVMDKTNVQNSAEEAYKPEVATYEAAVGNASRNSSQEVTRS